MRPIDPSSFDSHAPRVPGMQTPSATPSIEVLSKVLNVETGATRKGVTEALKRLSNGHPGGRLIRETRESYFAKLNELIGDAQVMSLSVDPIDYYSAELHDLIADAPIGATDTGRYTDGLHVMDISRKVDGSLKGGSLREDGSVREGSRVEEGIAFVYSEKPNTAVILMEHEPGSVHDLKSVLNGSCNGDHSSTSFFKPFLPVSFRGRSVKTGLLNGWGCVAMMDGDSSTRSADVKVAVVGAKVEHFKIPKKPATGIFPVDITESVNECIGRSGKQSGKVIVSTPHTTVGIMAGKPQEFDSIRETLTAIAPHDIAYKHNKTAGDNNGMSHLMAEFMGAFELCAFRDGKLDLGESRLLSVDCDVQQPREREVIVAVL